MFTHKEKKVTITLPAIPDMGTPFRVFAQMTGDGTLARGWWRSGEFEWRADAERFGTTLYKEYGDIACWFVMAADQDLDHVLRTHDLLGTGPVVCGDLS